MEYSLKELKVADLVNYIDKDLIDLNPDYQRNFIWTPSDQSSLVDTILKGYAMPTFFMYQYENGSFEMVDGQQRSKTIYRFVKGLISSSKDQGSLTFKTCNQDAVLNYVLPFIVISPMHDSDKILREFYVLINKSGKHLNTPEMHKSEFFDKVFMQLANDVLDNQNLINLSLFTQASRNRMNDRAYVEELLAYLKFGVKDKRNAVEKLFEVDIDKQDYDFLKVRFEKVIERIETLNSYYPIKSTRYKQKNDFFTLFNFVNDNLDEAESVFIFWYRILLVLDGVDEEGRQFIRPSNEDCNALRDYANNCVTQSNSKTARENRLKFFNSILKNTSVDGNDTLNDVLGYIEDLSQEITIDLEKVGDYYLPNIDILESIKRI